MALAAGIVPTHLDAHMGTAQMPEFTAIYRRLGQRYRLPVLLPASLADYNPASYAGTLDHARYDAEVAAARAAGEPVFDIVLETPWARKTDAETAYRAMFEAIPTGSPSCRCTSTSPAISRRSTRPMPISAPRNMRSSVRP